MGGSKCPTLWRAGWTSWHNRYAAFGLRRLLKVTLKSKVL